MRTDIHTVDDLRSERARLKNQMELSKMHMRQEITAIKTELNPARQAVGMVSDLLTTPKKGLLPIGVGIGVDVLLKRGLLARAGWLPRLVVPFIARNVVTNLIYKNRTSLVEQALMWVKKATDKPAKAADPATEVVVKAALHTKKKHLNGKSSTLVKH